MSRGSVLPSRSLQESNETAAAWIWRRYASNFCTVAASFGAEVSQAEPAILDFFMELLPRDGTEGDATSDRQDLWLLLLLLVVRRGLAGQVDPALVRGLIDESEQPLGTAPRSLAQLVSCEANLPMRTYMSAEFSSAFEQLGSPVLAQIVVDTLLGKTVEQIAESLGCVPWTVGRKLKLIRLKWTAGGEDDD